MLDVVFGEELGEFGLKGFEGAEVVEVGELDRIHRAVLVLLEDEDVDDADAPCRDESEKFVGRLSREVALPGGNSTMTKSTGPSASSGSWAISTSVRWEGLRRATLLGRPRCRLVVPAPLPGRNVGASSLADLARP